jgi:hypothetical protein
MSAHVLPPLAVNSKSERKISSLPLLGFEPVVSGMLAHLSDHSAKSHPLPVKNYEVYSTNLQKMLNIEQLFSMRFSAIKRHKINEIKKELVYKKHYTSLVGRYL